MSTLSLWDYSASPETKGLPEIPDASAMRIWEIDMYGLCLGDTMNIKLNPGGCRVLLSIGDSLCSVDVDFSSSSPEPPPVLTVMGFWPGMEFFNSHHMVGCWHEVVVSIRHRDLLVRYRLKDGSVRSLKKHYTSRISSIYRLPAMDEHSGRLVIPQSKYIVVFDFALVHQS